MKHAGIFSHDDRQLGTSIENLDQVAYPIGLLVNENHDRRSERLRQRHQNAQNGIKPASGRNQRDNLWHATTEPIGKRKSPAKRGFSWRVSEGTRTPDRLDHNQELYQLSYAHRETVESTSDEFRQRSALPRRCCYASRAAHRSAQAASGG
jgi:hypothetical protein